MSGGDCGCGCAGAGNCGGAQRRDWLSVGGAPQQYAGRVSAPVPFMVGIDDDPESLSPEGTSPPIELPTLPSLPTVPGLPSSIPSWVPWAGGALLVYLLVR